MSLLRGPSGHRAAAFPRRVAGSVGSQAARRAQPASALRRRQGGGPGSRDGGHERRRPRAAAAMHRSNPARPRPRRAHPRPPAGRMVRSARRTPPRRDARARLGHPAARATVPDPAPSANHAPRPPRPPPPRIGGPRGRRASRRCAGRLGREAARAPNWTWEEQNSPGKSKGEAATRRRSRGRDARGRWALRSRDRAVPSSTACAWR